MEFLKDYEFRLQYHSGKANIVADTLSYKSIHASTMMIKKLKLLEKLSDVSKDSSMNLLDSFLNLVFLVICILF